ncbi:transglutaminase domain-containing protein [Deinococcus cellulosilyticus]|uniref:Uncharacterized protein n=1 Tax=Deinococcus cellulosilyticus (strain DSM 18568 / NBRC 106333 / KACC 11606 / 5516J-15) TaxID=1223518 RepID=A0A511N1R0_DEIC1|nr:transglutaminase domain-containing protein [Deinococcus cellulosilyticus]GEM46398.1 hypothetical protein DC3_20330 [Deinococcus cellulosilyticus NBRC 106333 = KACC 11606]
MEHPHLKATRILDFHMPDVQELLKSVPQTGSSRVDLQLAHQAIAEQVLPIYTVHEWQPASVTLRKGKGSCSQRIACLEAFARARNIPTRVRALWVSGTFWNARFPWTKWAIPRRILLIWPQFGLEEGWLDLDELYASTEQRISEQAPAFSNTGETLFEALTHSNMDFLGKGCEAGLCPLDQSLSRFVLEQGKWYACRDDLLTELGSFQDSLRGRMFEWIYGQRPSVVSQPSKPAG